MATKRKADPYAGVLARLEDLELVARSIKDLSEQIRQSTGLSGGIETLTAQLMERAARADELEQAIAYLGRPGETCDETLLRLAGVR